MLPSFDILLEIINPAAAPRTSSSSSSVLVGIQTVILVLSILVRGSCTPLIGAIALAWLCLLCAAAMTPESQGD